MNFFIFPSLLILFLLSFITVPSSRAVESGRRGVEVIYPFTYGGGPGCGSGVNAGPYSGRQGLPYSLRFDGEVRVEITEIKDGVEIRLTSEDEKTKKELRLMGRMIKLINDMEELEAEGR